MGMDTTLPDSRWTDLLRLAVYQPLVKSLCAIPSFRLVSGFTKALRNLESYETPRVCTKKSEETIVQKSELHLNCYKLGNWMSCTRYNSRSLPTKLSRRTVLVHAATSSSGNHFFLYTHVSHDSSNSRLRSDWYVLFQDSPPNTKRQNVVKTSDLGPTGVLRANHETTSASVKFC